MNWQRLTNGPVVALLRSPLNGLISDSVLLIAVTGTKSGHQYSTPVNYVRLPETNEYLIVSNRDRTWWRNLRGGAQVQILVKRQLIDAYGAVLEDPDQVVSGVLAVLRQSPSYREHAGISLKSDGNPSDPGALERLAQLRVIVSISAVNGDSVRQGKALIDPVQEQETGTEAMFR